MAGTEQNTLDWLLDADPAIRWQVMRDLTGDGKATVAAERARVAREGWGARLIALQGDDGNWGGGAYSPKWVSTTYTLLLLRHLGVDPADERMREAVSRVRDKVRWRRPEPQPFFSGKGETCVTGMILALGSYFGETDDELVAWLLEQHLDDGGWNCQAPARSDRGSFHTTISVLEALLEYERAEGAESQVAEARARGHEYLLSRRLMYSLSTGELINKRWLLLSFPPHWFYDVLRALDYLRAAGIDPDPRCEEAVSVLHDKRRPDGTWPLQGRHPGKEHFQMEEGPGKPSRWNTLRALRVFHWYGDS
jgi:hypothetical protein